MKATKVVKVLIDQDECGNTVVAVVFGVEGQGSNGRRFGRFTETNRVEMGWGEGYALRHFDGWVVDAPVVHPTETIVQAVEAAMMAAAGWDEQEDAKTKFPAQSGGSRQRGSLAA